MLNFRWKLLVAAVAAMSLMAACGDGDDSNNDSNNISDAGDVDEDTSEMPDGGQDVQPERVTWAEVSEIFEDRNCAGCHGQISNSYQSVVDEWIEGDDGNVLEEMMSIRHRITEDDATVVIQWIEDGYPEE